MLRRPNDEKNAFDEQVWPNIKPARRGSMPAEPHGTI
jgi:hypothetical protein